MSSFPDSILGKFSSLLLWLLLTVTFSPRLTTFFFFPSFLTSSKRQITFPTESRLSSLLKMFCHGFRLELCVFFFLVQLPQCVWTLAVLVFCPVRLYEPKLRTTAPQIPRAEPCFSICLFETKFPLNTKHDTYLPI